MQNNEQSIKVNYSSDFGYVQKQIFAGIANGIFEERATKISWVIKKYDHCIG